MNYKIKNIISILLLTFSILSLNAQANNGATKIKVKEVKEATNTMGTMTRIASPANLNTNFVDKMVFFTRKPKVAISQAPKALPTNRN